MIVIDYTVKIFHSFQFNHLCFSLYNTTIKIHKITYISLTYKNPQMYFISKHHVFILQNIHSFYFNHLCFSLYSTFNKLHKIIYILLTEMLTSVLHKKALCFYVTKKKKLFHKYQLYTSLWYFALSLFPTNNSYFTLTHRCTYNKVVFEGSLIHIDPTSIYNTQ